MQHLPYAIELLSDKRVVKITHAGVMDYDGMVDAKTALLGAMTAQGWKKALVIMKDTIIEVLTPQIAKLLAPMDVQFPGGGYFALVRPGQLSFDYFQLMKSVVESWSESRVETFLNEWDALRWLASKTDSATHSLSGYPTYFNFPPRQKNG
jgi:hypothetical protein